MTFLLYLLLAILLTGSFLIFLLALYLAWGNSLLEDVE